MSTPEDDETPEQQHLGEAPESGAPDMLPPPPPFEAPPAVEAPRSRRSNAGLILMVAIVAALAVGGGTAAFVLFDDDEEEVFVPVGTDLTEGMEPFDPSAAEGYHPFAAEQDMWIPLPDEEEWSHEDVGDASATFYKTDEADTVILICGDIEDGRYPADFTDREAWFDAETARNRGSANDGDSYTLLEGPDYGDYVIDGRQAFLIEVQYRWTQWDDPEAGPTEVDYTRAHAYLYVDRGDLAPVRCGLTAHEGASAGYEEGLAALLEVRAEPSSAAD